MSGYNASCLGKIRHPTKQEAQEHKAQMGRTSGYTREVTVYYCRICGGYHVGRLRKGDAVPTIAKKRRAQRLNESDKGDEEC